MKTGVLIASGVEKLKKSGLLKKLMCTDSSINTQEINDDFADIRSLAEPDLFNSLSICDNTDMNITNFNCYLNFKPINH